MRNPILYPADEVAFNNNGLGILADCISCKVTEEANGIFELSLQYPENGKRANLIELDCIIKAKPNRYAEPQLFRIYSISKPMNSKISVNAQHISYDLSGTPVLPFSSTSAVEAFQKITQGSLSYSPFSFWTDVESKGNLAVIAPTSVRSIIGDTENSILSVYGGELEFDNFAVKLHNKRGKDKGFTVRYGKNLKSLKQDENCANVVNGICPYYIDNDSGDVVMLSDPVIYVPGNFSHDRVISVDFSSEFERKPTEEELQAVAVEYILNNNIGSPDVSLTVSYVQTDLDDVSLFDTVGVIFPRSKINTKAVVNRVVYDSLLEKVDSVSLGSIVLNIADTIAGQQRDISNKPGQKEINAVVSQSVSNATTTKLKSTSGSKTLNIDGAVLTVLNGSNSAFELTTDNIGNALLSINGIQKMISWKDNGDGTFSIVGS